MDSVVSTSNLSRKQAQSLNACQHATFNLWEGSIRAGKTYVSILAFLMFLAVCPNGGELVIVGRNLGSIYRNFFRTIETSAGLRAFKAGVHYKQNAPKAIIFGREVQVIGLNDVRAEEKIRGMTIQAVYVDELTVILEQTFKQIQNRMSLATSRMFATTNPDSPAHWFKTEYIDTLHERKDWRRFHFVMDDNPSLSPEVKQRLASQYKGLWYKRFILGLWVAAEGAIYDMWDPDQLVIPWDDLPEMRQLLSVGVDYGTTNATAALALGLGIDNNLYLVDEWRIDKANRQQNWTDAELAAGLAAWLPQPHTPHGDTHPKFVLVDPSAASFKAQLYHDKLRNVRDADNDVAYGIRTMASLFGSRRLLVADKCKGFINEAPGYSWDPKATEKGQDKPIKTADHSLDGARYAVTTTEALWRPYITL